MKKLLFLGTIVLVLAINACSNSTKLPDIGEKCNLTKECLSAISEKYYDKLNEVCNRKDEEALRSMISDKTVYVLNPYLNSYTMKEKKFGKCQIEVNTGDGTFEVWVASEFIKPVQ
mgnify:FL=1